MAIIYPSTQIDYPYGKVVEANGFEPISGCFKDVAAFPVPPSPYITDTSFLKPRAEFEPAFPRCPLRWPG